MAAHVFSLEDMRHLLLGEGATLDSNRRRLNYDRGYQVGITDVPYNNPLAAYRAVLNMAINNKSIGIWRDEKDGTFYIDESVYVESLEEASALAYAHNQQSICYWNLVGIEGVNPCRYRDDITGLYILTYNEYLAQKKNRE